MNALFQEGRCAPHFSSTTSMLVVIVPVLNPVTSNMCDVRQHTIPPQGRRERAYFRCYKYYPLRYAIHGARYIRAAASCTRTCVVDFNLARGPSPDPNPNPNPLGGSRSAGAVTQLRRVFWCRFSIKTPGGRTTRPALTNKTRTLHEVLCRVQLHIGGVDHGPSHCLI